MLERPLYNREHADGLFTPLTYLVFKSACGQRLRNEFARCADDIAHRPVFEEVLLATAVSVGASAAVFYAVGFQGSFGACPPRARQVFFCFFFKGITHPIKTKSLVHLRRRLLGGVPLHSVVQQCATFLPVTALKF